MSAAAAVSRCPVGVLNVAKPAGVTSRDVVNLVQRLVRPLKCGHAGTLDPLATGVLVVCVGAATRLIEQVQAGRKIYRGTFRLGLTSDTDDITGEVITAGDPTTVSHEQLASTLAKFVGRIEQVPPQVSAVHVDGERAYRRVRRGETVAIAPRIVEIDAIELVDFNSTDFTITVQCGGGTYIRAIGRDVGQRLGCGAVMTALKRTAVGPFQLSDALPADQLDADTLRRHLQPPSAAVAYLKTMSITHEQVRAVRCGQSIAVSEPIAPDVDIALLDPEGELVGLGCCNAVTQRIQPRIVLPTID